MIAKYYVSFLFIVQLTSYTHTHTQSLGQTGKVVKVLPSGDVQVGVGDRRWVYCPSCLQPVAGQEISNQDTKGEDLTTHDSRAPEG